MQTEQNPIYYDHNVENKKIKDSLDLGMVSSELPISVKVRLGMCKPDTNRKKIDIFGNFDRLKNRYLPKNNEKSE